MPKKAGKMPKKDAKAREVAALERQAMMREKTAAQMKANKKRGPGPPSKGRDAPTKGAAELRKSGKSAPPTRGGGVGPPPLGAAANPAPAAAAAPSRKEKKRKKTCRDGLRCRREGCSFAHPAGHHVSHLPHRRGRGGGRGAGGGGNGVVGDGGNTGRGPSSDAGSDDPRSFLIPITEVHVERGPDGLLGAGALGEVRRGQYKEGPVALKGLFMLRTDAASLAAIGGALNPEERKRLIMEFQQECEHMHKCQHKNIVPFFGIVVDDTPAMEPLYLAMQMIESGTLQDVIHRERYAAMRTYANCIPLSAQLTALSGLFAALEYLAAIPLIHRDVKPANVLAHIVPGEGGEGFELVKVLLADFGLAKQLHLSVTRAMISGGGTPLYQAPEMREQEDAKSPKADVFSAGVLAVEMNTGAIPNPGPEMRREGRKKLHVDEEERRADDMAAIRNGEIRVLAERCVVDYDADRADASEMVRRCAELRAQMANAAAEAASETTLLVQQVQMRVKIPVQVTARLTLGAVKQKLALSTGIDVASQRLLHAGRVLEDARTIDDYNLLDETVIHMVQKVATTSYQELEPEPEISLAPKEESVAEWL